MITAGLQGVDFVVANTDAQALTMSKAERVIQMGVQATEGLGAGSQPEVGRAAAEEMIDEIRDHLAGVHMVFVTAGMGGGTGTGAAPIIAKAARESTKGQVIAVVQPHRFTRLAALFEQFCTCFNDADAVIVAHVYPAGEAPIPGIDRDALVAGLRTHGHRQVIALDGPDKLAPLIAGMAKPGDYVVCLGAGSITQWAYALPGELAAAADR
jgi:hypothetical protein